MSTSLAAMCAAVALSTTAQESWHPEDVKVSRRFRVGHAATFCVSIHLFLLLSKPYSLKE